MSYQIEQRLEYLGLVLPPPRPRLNNRLGSKLVDNKVYVSGHPSRLLGTAGEDVSAEEAYEAAREVAIACVSTIREAIDSFDDIIGFDKLTGFVRSARHFVDQALVIKGASDLIIELFAESGMHARSAIRVTQLPLGAAVEIEMIVSVKSR